MNIDISVLNTATQMPKAEDTKLKKACKDFEAVLVSQMLGAMRKTVPEDNDLFGSSEEEGMFRDMLDQQTAQQVADKDSMGIAELMYRQLSKKL
jgi:peptidoglycan hydrolase FlgJ